MPNPRFGINLEQECGLCWKYGFCEEKILKNRKNALSKASIFSQRNLCSWAGILIWFFAQEHFIRFIVELDSAIWDILAWRVLPSQIPYFKLPHLYQKRIFAKGGAWGLYSRLAFFCKFILFVTYFQAWDLSTYDCFAASQSNSIMTQFNCNPQILKCYIFSRYDDKFLF